MDEPKSTVYDALTKYTTDEEKEKLKKIFEQHRKSNETNNDIDNNYAFHQVGTEMSKPVTRFKK